jgi:hypothetical protein
MIATARMDAVRDPGDLAVKLAKTRVALAAFKRKHDSDPVEDEDLQHAITLREYYSEVLEAGEYIALDEQVVPREDVRQILQSVLTHYGSKPSEVRDKDILQRVLVNLDRMISRELTGTDASQLINDLERLGRTTPSPSYDADVLLGNRA